MKKTLLKIANVLKTIYSYGITACLFASGAAVPGYIAALIIGGDPAAAICAFIYKKFFFALIVGGGCIVLLGLIAMYLSGESSMKLDRKKKSPNSPNR